MPPKLKLPYWRRLTTYLEDATQYQDRISATLRGDREYKDFMASGVTGQTFADLRNSRSSLWSVFTPAWCQPCWPQARFYLHTLSRSRMRKPAITHCSNGTISPLDYGYRARAGGTRQIVVFLTAVVRDLTNLVTGLTVIADLAAIDNNVKAQSQSIYPNTFRKAQEYNLQMEKVVGAGYLPHSRLLNHTVSDPMTDLPPPS